MLYQNFTRTKKYIQININKNQTLRKFSKYDEIGQCKFGTHCYYSHIYKKKIKFNNQTEKWLQDIHL